MSRSMVVTLGHNASAIAIEDGHILGGYEEERLSGVKSDSSFPARALGRLVSQFGGNYDDVCVGHWFTSGIIQNTKYIDLPALQNLCNGNIHSIAVGLTHHDSHMLSAQVFANHYGLGDEYTSIVADGFGTFGECISVYQTDSKTTRLLSRYFGYGNSLGMLYQYATAYLGMKMHNHEYKMLGYEAHLPEVLMADRIVILNDIIETDAAERVKKLFSGQIDQDHDPVVNKGALAQTQHDINNLLDSVLVRLDTGGLSMYDRRVIISYYVQSIVESVMATIVQIQQPKNLLVSGGLFYNVKLNHLLSSMVNRFCAMPLAGDQGAGLGVYQGVHGNLVWPGHLYWGHRDLRDLQSRDGIIVVENAQQAAEVMADELDHCGMVNIVRGAMEFGPRSLCNTATIAKPTMAVIETINAMNDRTTVMPMAPAMTRAQADRLLNGVNDIVGSLEYMIVTRDVKEEHVESIEGAAHKYALTGRTTCRPQLVGYDDTMMYDLLFDFGPLINTSFNYHGVPIVFDAADVLYSHKMQNQTSAITTVVIA